MARAAGFMAAHSTSEPSRGPATPPRPASDVVAPFRHRRWDGRADPGRGSAVRPFRRYALTPPSLRRFIAARSPGTSPPRRVAHAANCVPTRCAPVPRRLRREQPRVRPDPHPPQVQPVGVPARPDGRVPSDAAVGVLLAGELQQVHLRVLQVERLASQIPGQGRPPRAVQGVVAVVEPHGVVEEGEQEHNRRVGARRLGKEGEARRGDPPPVALAVQERILARGPLEDGGNEPCGVRYGDARARTHAGYRRFRGRVPQPERRLTPPSRGSGRLGGPTRGSDCAPRPLPIRFPPASRSGAAWGYGNAVPGA